MKSISVFAGVAVAGLLMVCGGIGQAAADVAVGPGPTNYTEQQQPSPGTCHYRTAANGETLPDPDCTPGAISPKVTPDTLATTICRTGYTKSIRPPAAITEAEKRENAAAYGYDGSLRASSTTISCPSNSAGTRTIRATCGSSPADRRTRKTASNLGCTSWSAKAGCHSGRRRRRSPPTGRLR
jgi:hypothetical protein